MKNRFIICFVIVLIAGLTSCTLEKRHYRDGFYLDWNHNSAKQNETIALSEPIAVPELPIRIVKAVDTSSSTVEVKQQVENPALTNHSARPATGEKSYAETPEDLTVNSEMTKTPAPIEKDRKQAVGAGIAAAIFFILGMVGLIIKGTAPPTGIFIGAAFLCFVLCIFLASFLYPREPVVKQPKEPTVVSSGSRVTFVAGVVVAVIALSLLGVFAFIYLILIGIF